MDLSYRNLGAASALASPLVILHGMLGSSRNWITVGKDLADAGYRVLAPDLRNHGNSPHAPEMTYDIMAADVAAWMDRLDLGPVVLVGHSMGGKVAMLLACRQPQRVQRLVIVDIAPKAYRWVGHRMEFAAMQELDLASLESRAEAEMRMEGRVPDWAMRKFLTTNLEGAAEGAGWRWTVDLPAIVAGLPELEKNPLNPEERYLGPTRFIIGGKSSYVRPADDWPIVLKHFPNAQLTVLENSGHNPHFDARSDFVTAIN